MSSLGVRWDLLVVAFIFFTLERNKEKEKLIEEVGEQLIFKDQRKVLWSLGATSQY